MRTLSEEPISARAFPSALTPSVRPLSSGRASIFSGNCNLARTAKLKIP